MKEYDTGEKVAVVIVTWNSARDIRECLQSVYSQTYPVNQVVVVDNSSGDSTVEIIEKEFPQALLLPQKKNLGFAQANNIGINHVNTDWILTLNPDAFIREDYIEALLRFTKDKPRTGSIGGKLLRFKETDTAPVIIDSSGIEIYRSRRVVDRGSGEIDTRQWDDIQQVFGVCAAAALYRKVALEDVKIDGEIFPSEFFSYYEDADLAWRMWRKRWEAWYFPEAVCIHRRGGSPTGSSFSRYLTHRNRSWLIARNEPVWRTILAQPEFLEHEILMFFRLLRYPSLWRAVIEGFRGYLHALKQRKCIKDVNISQPPFIRGTGFNRKRNLQAINTAFIKGKKGRD